MPFFLVDESGIVAQHDVWIDADPELIYLVEVLNTIVDFVDRVIRIDEHQSDDHLTQLRLAVRCLNDVTASLRLIRSGYWQPAFATIRDLLETQFLLDLLMSDADAATAWRTLPDKDRRAEFAPLQVRKRLDERDGFAELKRHKAYDQLSRYASHATPEGFSIISPEELTQIGPFADRKLLTAALQELVLRSAPMALLVKDLASSKRATFQACKSRFLVCMEDLLNRHFPGERQA